MELFFLTLLLAGVGSFAGARLKLPAGTLIGAIIAVGIFQALTGLAVFPAQIRTLSASLTGTCLGAFIGWEDLKALRKIIGPAVFMVLAMLGFNILCSLFLSRTSDIDLTTAFLSTAPGGTTEMALVAIDLGANTSVISLIQISRLIVVIFTIPGIIRLSERYLGGGEEAEGDPAQDRLVPVAGRWETARILMIGIGGGVLGKLSGIPAGTLMFSLFSVVIRNLLRGEARISPQFKRCAQCCNGALIGTRFLVQDFHLLGGALWQIAVIVLGWICLNTVMGILIRRFWRLPIRTALLSTAAGGLSDVGFLSIEYGCNIAQVSVLQLCRVVSVILLYPTVIQVIVHFFR